MEKQDGVFSISFASRKIRLNAVWEGWADESADGEKVVLGEGLL